MNYRKLPPVEPVEVPRRFSMTLLERHDNCPRAAYLGVKYKNGPGSIAMDRGTLAHAVHERQMKDLIRSGERAFAADDHGQAAAMTAAVVDEVLRDRPDLVVPRREVDDVREMAYHWAVGFDVDPSDVAGIERLMVLDLECGWTVSGRLDLVSLPSVELGQVDDYKSGQALPAQDEYAGKLQPLMYAVLLMYGSPVDVADCPVCGDDGTVTALDPVTARPQFECPTCQGRGYVETRGEPFGGHLRGVLTREVYPKPKLRDDGTLHHREMLLDRTAIADFRADLERSVALLAGRFESRDFPARAGSWCSICPAPHECPLPAELRDFAGEVNTVKQAEEAWAKAQLAKRQLAAVEREVKNFCKAHNAVIRVGDERWEWQAKSGRAVRRVAGRSDWDGLAAAVLEAAEYGTPFDIDEFVVSTAGTEFKRSKVTKEERVHA